MFTKRHFYALCFSSLLCMAAFAQSGPNYQTPPKEILDLVLAKTTPGVTFDDKAEWMLLTERSEFPTVEDLAQPEYRIGGLRIDPSNFAPSRGASSVGLQAKNVKTGKLIQIEGLPAKPHISSVQWSPDKTKFAFVNTGNTTVDLYVVKLADAKAVKINTSPLNIVMGGRSFQWSGNNKLIYKTVVAGKKLADRPPAPAGPLVQENMGKAAASRTYEDLLKNAYDEALFEYYATAQLVSNDMTKETPIGAPAIYRGTDISPDGRYIMTTVINKPFSYLVPARSFPNTVAVIDWNGRVLKQLAKNPSGEGSPIGFDDVENYPRNFNWRSDEPATVTYVQALDNGLGRKKAEYRDALYSMSVEGTEAPKELFKTRRRFAGITWGTKDVAIFNERMTADRKMRMSRFNPTTGAVDSLYERSSNDAYSDIGFPMTQKNSYGENVLILLNGKELLLRSDGASPEGDMPLLQTFDITNGSRKILWQSKAPYYESIVDVIDPAALTFVTSKQSPTETPNYYIRNLKKGTATPVTAFTNPYAGMEGVKKEKITYKREDGIGLSGDLYLPKGYDAKRDGPLPVIMWAYPREYKSANDAAQIRGSKYTFTRLSYGSPVFWVTQGYAVLDNAEMPIVGEGDKEPNDNFIPQLYLNAHAAIQKLAQMGVGDSNRVAVGGHSYGAFMTANLLAHTSLFKAGIARSGAYNRTLTPFGFQAEERTYWEAPDVYNAMSPFAYADKIKTPILLVHGEMDDNPGTFPIQSERLYNAIKGHGGTVRYVVLPYEAHGYAAKENILHLLWEQNQWLDKWVKNADKNKPVTNTGNKSF